MSYATRLFLGAVAVLLVSVAALFFATDRWLRPELETTLALELERDARVVALSLPRNTAGLNAAAHRLAAVVGRRVALVDGTGRVLGDSDFDDASLALVENQVGQPEIQDALAGRTARAIRRSVTSNRPELRVALPAWPGVISISAPLDQVETQVRSIHQTILLASLAALLVGAILAGLAGRAMGQPLRLLGGAVRSLAAGERPAFPTSSAPEVRQLIRALRGMNDDLDARMDELRRGREETETLIQSMIEGVMAVDADGNVVVSNDATRRLLSFAPEEPIPNARELFHQRDARQIVERALAGEAVLDRETEIDGRTLLFTARPLPNGGAVLVLHDVSELKRLEAVRRDFVANVSHELKTPLTSISGYADTLRAEDPDPATRRRFLDVILTNARRMQRLVDDLLDLAHLESGRWQPAARTVDAATIAREAWTPLAARAAEREVKLELADRELRLHADPEALRQILGNLFENSIRHTPGGGRIMVSSVSLDDGVELRVGDTGSGISTEHLPRVFERFYRADPGRSRQEGGTGLGLAIVRHLTEAHNGRVSVESVLGEGTTVRVFFPDPEQTA